MVIKKKFTSETSHIVRNAVSTRCKYNIHGHSYKWFIYLEGVVKDYNGMVLDFKELKPIKDFIDLFDHATVLWSEEDEGVIEFFKSNFKRVLIMEKNTTAENMASLVFKFATDWLNKKHENVRVKQVDVWETETGCAIATDYDKDDILVYVHENLD